jgi:dihydroorotase
MNLLIRGGRVIDPANGVDGVADVLILDGRVSRVGPGLAASPGAGTTGVASPGGIGAVVPVVDATGRVVTPGLIDMHVHLREPGQEYKETIVTGTRAAAAGGFTAIAAMANTRPVNDTRAVTDYVLAEARARGVVRVYPIGAVTRGLKGAELAELGELAEAGCVAYSDDGRPVMHSGLFRRALEYAQAFGKPIISHAEDLHLSEDGVMHEGFVSTDLGLRGIPGAAEEVMVARDIALAELTGTPVHIAHVSTAAAVRLLREAKARGVPVTGEVTPHHLILTDEALRGYDPNAKMAPPLRSKRDVEACREALADGTLDAVATDHAPHALTDKEVELDHAANGIVGLETAVGLCLTHLVRERILDLTTLITRLTVGPARILDLPGGTLTPGAPGDVTILDLDRSHTVEPTRFQSKGRNTPFGGFPLVGAPILTVVGGQVVMQDGTIRLERLG